MAPRIALRAASVFALTVGLLVALALPAAAQFPSSWEWILYSENDGSGFELRTINVKTGVSGPATLVGGNPIPGAYSRTGARVTFFSSTGGDTEIWIQREDGSNAHALTTNAVSDMSPHFSPDGSQIVFVHGGSLWTMDSDGSHQVEVEPGSTVTQPVWSPNGNWIAFSVIGAGTGWDVYRIHPDGTELQPLAATAANELMADYSPDGSTLAYQRSPSVGNYVIFRMDADGSHRRQLIAKPDIDLTNPEYSASGKRLLYNHWNDVDQDIWSARASDGRERTVLRANGDDNYLIFVD